MVRPLHKKMTLSAHLFGAGNASNGCSPDVKPCTDAADIFAAGDSVVIQNTVNIDATFGKTFVYGGGDRIVASDPITVVRGGYPKEPGSLMAGSVEVLDLNSWGTEFDAPVGVDIGLYFAAFEFCSFFFMAAEDNTEVTLANGRKIILNQGESSAAAANQGDKLRSNKPIQVDFITGDTLSYYELRWFGLWPTTSWSNSYLTPVGDTVGRTKMLLFNPTSSVINIDVTILVNGTQVTKMETLKARKATLTDVIPTDSGATAKSKGGQKFIALSFTDTEYRTSTGQITDGQWYDWGFAVTPTYLLTPQVLIGWGYVVRLMAK
jgi:IgGFc binding protein